MKNLKVCLLACLLICFGVNISAQTTPFRFGISTGFNLSTAIVDDASKSKFKPGYNIGVTAEYQLPKNFLVQSGLFFSAKGSKQEDLNGSYYVGGRPDFTHTFNQLYLELPIYGAYRKNLSDKLNVVFGAGPYFAYGIGGKTKQKLHNSIWGDGSTEKEWDTFSDGIFDESRDWLRGESLKRFDFGAGIKADLEYCRYSLGVGFACSIINIAKEQEYQSLDKYRNLNLNISMGYKF